MRCHVTTNSSGSALNSSFSFAFSLYNASTGGSALWTETQTLTVSSGKLNALLGSVSALSLPFDQDYYLGVKVSTDNEMTPRYRVASSAYSYHANRADTANTSKLQACSGATLNNTRPCKTLAYLSNNDGSWSPCCNETAPFCPEGMAYISSLGGYCIDKYEASSSGGFAASVAGAAPWVSITQTDAKAKCQAVGKHLCTGGEWFNAANLAGEKSPTTEQNGEYYNCNTGSSAALATGSRPLCKSDADVYDMIGNVWEWTDETYTTDPTPGVGSGYVTGWNYTTNLPTSTSGTPSASFGDDYYWDYTSGTVAALRGGAWDYGAGAGSFALLVNYAPSNSFTNVGFRCCK